MTHKFNAGFTLIELILAMALFSTILVVSTGGFIGLNETFARGQIRNQLSGASQDIENSLTSQLQSLPPSTAPQANVSNGWNRLCFPGVHYVWQASGGLYARAETVDCQPANVEPTNFTNQKQLANPDFTVQQLAVSLVGSSTNLYTLLGVITTSDPSALNIPVGNPQGITCKGTAQTPAAKRCAVQTFNFITSVRGGA